MGVLSIHKEIEKKKYAQSPLGKVERELTKIYDALKLKNGKLSEELAHKVYDIRDENEKWQMKYIEDRIKADREAVDAKLLDSMTRELNLLKEHGY
jgi:hypothetical protein